MNRELPRWAAPISMLRRWMRSEQTAELCWWYLVCVLATSAAKLSALASVYRHSDAFVLDEMAVSSGPALPRVLLLALVLARDLLQSALVTAGVFLLASAFSARIRPIVPRVAAVLLAIVILSNHISFMQLGTFVSTTPQ